MEKTKTIPEISALRGKEGSLLGGHEELLREGEICGPHCDSRILHAPGECEVCDYFPTLQKAREVWGITFTGRPISEKQPIECPAVQAREMENLSAWGGNVPQRPAGYGVHRREAVEATRKKREG
jgi:hypothetical protein